MLGEGDTTTISQAIEASHDAAQGAAYFDAVDLRSGTDMAYGAVFLTRVGGLRVRWQ